MKSRLSLRLQTLLVAFIAISFISTTFALPGSAPAPQAGAVALPQGVERLTSVEGITEYTLPNGLHVLLFPDQSKPTITVNLTYIVGSRNENYGETGMAHLLEHMMFKGTPNHRNIPQELNEHGARFNANTSFDRTTYFETMQASDANLTFALQLEADRMVNSFIARKDLDSEMTVVRNEFESGENSPGNILFERAMSTAFLWHNYGKTTIGARSDIENVPIERLQAFWRLYYQPDNGTLLVAGKFDEAKTLNQINDIYSKIPKPTRVIQKTYTFEPAQDGERSVTLRRVGDVQEVLAVYHIPSGADPDFAAVDILSTLLGDSPGGRLHKALVETKKATRVSGGDFQLREPGVMIFSAELRPDESLDAARDALLQTVEDVAKNPPTQEEVERARTQLLKDMEQTLNSSEDVGLQLSEWEAMGDWRLFFLHRDRLRKVTPADVQRVAQNYLMPSNRTLGLFIPTAKPVRAQIPDMPDVAAMVKDYKGDAAIAAGEAFDASPANIDSRTTYTTEPGGLKLALLPKKTRGNVVEAHLTLRFGDEKSLNNRATAGSLAGAMLSRGTTKHTRQQIKDEFDRLKASVSVSGGATSANVSIQTTRENLPAVLQLVGEILREPAFPAAELDQLKQARLAGAEQQRSDPSSIAVVALQRHLDPHPKGDPRYVFTPEEQIAAIQATTLDDVKKFYSDFYGASNGEFSVVGDFDAKQIEKLSNDLFGNWRSPRPFNRITSNFQEIAAENQSIETPDKENAFFIAAERLNIRDDDPDYPALLLANYILGGGELNSRLADRIRQKDGLSYGVGSQLSASPLDKNGQFVAFAIYAPQNAAKLETAFKEEIARALKDGFTAQEVAAAKNGLLQLEQVSRAQDNELAGTLASNRYIDRKMVWQENLEEKIGALTPEQVVVALRKYIDPAKITIVKAGDFSKAAGKAAPAKTEAKP